jgi:hypothetical protein
VVQILQNPHETDTFIGPLDKCGLSGGKFFYCVRDIKFRDLIFLYTTTKEKNKNVFAAVIKVSSADDLEVPWKR